MRSTLRARLMRLASKTRASRVPPFSGVRSKLVLWNIAVLGAILLLVGGGVYVSQSLALEAQVNGQLASQAQRELAGGLPLEALREQPAPTGSTGPTGPSGTTTGVDRSADADADAYRADASPNLFSLVIDMKGHVVSGASGVQALGLPDQAAVRPVLAGTAANTLVTTDKPGGEDGGVFRLYTVPVLANGHIAGALQVGTSLTPRYAELRQFLLLLTLCGVAGLALAAAGGFFLAHRALVPVRVAFERQRTFVADASHELRTPLSLIRAEAELLLRSLEREPAALAERGGGVERAAAHGPGARAAAMAGGEGEEDRGDAATAMVTGAGDDVMSQREMALDLLAETDYMNRLIKALLQLARIDRGQEVLAREEVDLGALAERACRFAQPLAAERGLTLTCEVEPGARPAGSAGVGDNIGAEAAVGEEGARRVWGDADRLRQLLLILVDNALRYTPAPGAVRVTCGGEAGKDGAAGRVVLRISDTGPGIAPEHVPHLFDRFYRVDKARSRELGGSGLGLAIGAWIAEAHGGTLSVVSTTGAGATFELTLPVAGPEGA